MLRRSETKTLCYTEALTRNLFSRKQRLLPDYQKLNVRYLRTIILYDNIRFVNDLLAKDSDLSDSLQQHS